MSCSSSTSSAAYGPYRALFDVSFSVPTGGIVALVGSNGAGKSTVARVVSGLVTASSGKVALCGHDVTGLPAYRIARLGLAHVVEGRGVFSSLTVEENLTLAFRQRAGRRLLAANLERAYTAFPILGERRRQMAGTLSGGQQRLLSLAKVLVVPPQVLIADELSLGLAPVVVDTVYEGLVEINRNGTALVVVEQQVSARPRAGWQGDRPRPRLSGVPGRSRGCGRRRRSVAGRAGRGRGHRGRAGRRVERLTRAGPFNGRERPPPWARRPGGGGSSG